MTTTQGVPRTKTLRRYIETLEDRVAWLLERIESKWPEGPPEMTYEGEEVKATRYAIALMETEWDFVTRFNQEEVRRIRHLDHLEALMDPECPRPPNKCPACDQAKGAVGYRHTPWCEFVSTPVVPVTPHLVRSPQTHPRQGGTEMARITGFRCDGPRCQNVAETEHIPDGWLTVKVHVSPEAAGRDPQKQVHGLKEVQDFHLCSNRCLANLGKERHKADLDSGKASRMGRKPGVAA